MPPAELEPQPDVSWLYLLIYFLLIVLLIAGVVALFIYYSDYSSNPYGFQIASLVSYTGIAIWRIFGRHREARSYNINHPAVRRVLPKLTILHAEFLCIVWIVSSLMVYYRARVPKTWLLNTGPKNIPPYDATCLVIAIAIMAVQVYLSRRILSRSLIAWVEK